MKKTINVIVKNPGRPPEVRQIPNTLEELQGIVGGYIEVLRLASDAAIICNEEGKLLELDYNFSIRHEDLVGPVIFVGIRGENFTDWPGGMRSLRALFGSSIERKEEAGA